MSVVIKVSVTPNPSLPVVFVSGGHPGGAQAVIVSPAVAVAGSGAVVCTREHFCPELSHTVTVNLPVAFAVGVGVHSMGVMMVGNGGV